MQKPKRQSHNYTSELELKTLLIRVKNTKFNNITDDSMNEKIDRCVRLYNKLKDKKYKTESKTNYKKETTKKLKLKAIELSEITGVNDIAYNRFGEIILLMIKKILTKSQFSGYTYKDEFYSDASHKILKYLHNFDHTLISERSGVHVNAFAYISQIIHNSVVYIIKTKNKEQKNIKKQISYYSLDHNLNIKNEETNNSSTFKTRFETDSRETKEVLIDEITNAGSLYNMILNNEIKDCILIYPEEYKISIDEYSKLKTVLKNTSIIRKQKEENVQ